MMASSTKMPSTTMKAKSETKLIEVPIMPMTAKAPQKEMGMPRATHIANEGRRNKDSTRKTSNNPRAAFSTIICNRPDGEDPGQPSFSEIAAKAEAAGIKAIFQPVASGNVSDADADAFAANLASAPKPIFAYCRSGTRCTILWSLANAGQMPAGDIIKAAAEAGYDMAPLAPRIAARG